MYIKLFFIFALVESVITLKIGDPNVCPKPVTGSKFDIVCCPDYFYQNGKCKACLPGKYGPDCALPCLTNYFGLQCKQMCNCTVNTRCDPRYGCVCYDGFTGTQCIHVCPQGRYGFNCTEECFCAQDAKCDPMTGLCLCPAGWFGHHCTKKCPFGKFGKDCNGTCHCSDDIACDFTTGKCSDTEDPNSDDDINESKSTIMIYIMMVAAFIGLVFVVTMILKVKEALCRMVQKPKPDTTKQKIKRRKAHPRPSNHNDNSQTGSFTAETEVSTLELPFEEEDLYCEIEDINATEPIGINAKMSLRSFSQNS